MDELKNSIRDILDFPKKGIIYKDITTLLADGRHFHRMVDLIAHRYIGKDVDQIVGVEARGFILGAALAYKLGAGITLVRKPGSCLQKPVRLHTVWNTAQIPLKFTKTPSSRGPK